MTTMDFNLKKEIFEEIARLDFSYRTWLESRGSRHADVLLKHISEDLYVGLEADEDGYVLLTDENNAVVIPRLVRKIKEDGSDIIISAEILQAYSSCRITVRKNDFTIYHGDMYNMLTSMMKETTVLDGFNIPMDKSGLVELRCSLISTPVALTLTIKKEVLNSIEEKILNNILKKIKQFCKLYSFKMVKSDVDNVINIIYDSEDINIISKNIIDEFLNKPIEDIAPGDE